MNATTPATAVVTPATPTALRGVVRAAVGGLEGDARLARARAFAYAALSAYWGAVTGGARCHRPPVGVGRLPAAVRRMAATVGAAMAAHPRPLAAYLLSTLYTSLLPESMRAALGAYFTPPAIADRLLDLVEEAGVDWLRVRAVDPAAGGGAFVTPVAVRIAAAHVSAGADSGPVLDAIVRQVRGIELDPFSGWMSWVFLETAIWEHCAAAGRRMPNLVVTQDALTVDETWDGTADLVIGNPPYGKVTPAPELRARYARSLFGHANLYGMFTDLAVRIAAADGVIGYVTPASFLGGQYFKNLRGLLGADAPPIAIDFITDRSGVFDDVLQETVLAVLGRRRESGTVSVHFCRPTGLDAACEVTLVGAFALPTPPHQPWLLPRRPDDVALLRRLATMPHRLSDYGYRVSTGPLVWNRHKKQLAERPGRGAYPLIWSEAITAAGEFRFSATRRNHVPYCRVLKGQEHLVVREPCVLVQRTTAKEQERRLLAAVLPAGFLAEHEGVVIENHVNVVRNGAPAAAGCAGCARLGVIATLLNSHAVDRIFRCTSGSVAVSAYELASMPLPSPDALRHIDHLLQCQAPADLIETAVNRAYGLVP